MDTNTSIVKCKKCKGAAPRRCPHSSPARPRAAHVNQPTRAASSAGAADAMRHSADDLRTTRETR